jgi:hypothetical protein
MVISVEEWEKKLHWAPFVLVLSLWSTATHKCGLSQVPLGTGG